MANMGSFVAPVIGFLALLTMAAAVSEWKYEDFEERIVGGEVTDVGDFPELVSVMTQPLIGDGEHICGGIIVNENHVLTTATCILGRAARNLQVMAFVGQEGEYYYEEYLDVNKIFIYDFFDEITGENDLAILRTDQFSMANGTQIPAILPEKGAPEPSSGSIVSVAGWGKDKYEGYQTSQHAVYLTYVTHDECVTLYGQALQSHHGCMMGHPGYGVCDGDEGGPALVDGVAVGMVAWNVGCDAYPAAVALLEYYRPWIDAVAAP